MGVKIPIQAELEDGRVLRGTCDQRDFARAEGADITQDTRITWVRFVAWSALSRSKQYGGSWEQFNSTDCVEAIDGAEEPTGAENGLDPGQSAPSAGS